MEVKRGAGGIILRPMVAALLLAWTVTWNATTTVVGPDGDPDVRATTLAATWQETGDEFSYTLDYGAGGPATRISCPLGHAAGFLAGELDREDCRVEERPSGADSFRPGFGDSVWDSARFPFDLLAKASEEVPFMLAGVAGEAGLPPTAARPLLPGLAEETELSDASGTITVGKRVEYEGAVWLGDSPAGIVSGRVTTRMYYEMETESRGVWQPFTTQTLDFHQVGWLLPPPPPAPPADRPTAVVSTSLGSFEIELYTDAAPETAGNFIRLAVAGYFDHTACHRVVVGFVDQCGDPTGTGWGGPGYQFGNEVDGGVRHDQWAVSMANAGPDTNGSQWFVAMGRIPRLDGGYSVFGTVVAGHEVVKAINRTAADASDRPLEPVVIHSVAVEGHDGPAPIPAPEATMEEALALAGQAEYRVVWGDPEDAERPTHEVVPAVAGDAVSVELVALGDEGSESVRTLTFSFAGETPTLSPHDGAPAVEGVPWALPGSWLFGVEGEWEIVAWPGEAAAGDGEGTLFHLAWRGWTEGLKVPVAGLVAYREFPEEEEGEAG